MNTISRKKAFFSSAGIGAALTYLMLPACDTGVNSSEDDSRNPAASSSSSSGASGGSSGTSGASGSSSGQVSVDGGQEEVGRPGGPGCGFTAPAFCDTFDAPRGNGNRSGQLNGILWGVSRNGPNNFGQQVSNAWSPVQLDACGTLMNGLLPPNDIRICNGHVVEAVNDGESVTALTMYVKQPFDFAGRTGTVKFDVSNNTRGSHAAWPEFWITDKPVPAPFAHLSSWESSPQNGFGIRLAGTCRANEGCGDCQGIAPYPRTTISTALVINNWVRNDQENIPAGNLNVQKMGCVKASESISDLNHYEVRVAQNKIEVYGTDAGTTGPLVLLGVINNPNLSLTRGLIWLEDGHYNGDKMGDGQRTNTFAWDNVGFDGPVLPADLAFDVPDNTQANGDGTRSLGWQVVQNQPKSFTIPGVTGINKASAGLLTLNFYTDVSNVTINYSVNNNAHTFNWTHPLTSGFAGWRTIALSVPLSDMVAGSNTIQIGSPTTTMAVSNIDLILVGGAGLP